MTSALCKRFVDLDLTSSSWDIESAIALEYINSQQDTCLNIAIESIARTDVSTPTLLTIQQSKWMALSPPLKRILNFWEKMSSKHTLKWVSYDFQGSSSGPRGSKTIYKQFYGSRIHYPSIIETFKFLLNFSLYVPRWWHIIGKN